MEIELYKDFGNNVKFTLKIQKNSNERIVVANEIRVRDVKDNDNKLDFDTIVYEKNLLEFIELLNCFVSNMLEFDKTYYVFYPKENKGYSAKIVQKKVQKREKEKIEYSLLVVSNESKKKIFLNKYDCKVIVSTFRSIYSKCTRAELL